MGEVRAQLFVSIDGVAEAPERWHFPYVNEELADIVQAFYTEVDALLLGKTTFDIFAASWPGRPDTDGLAQRINSMQKIVITSSPDIAEWNGARRLPTPTLDSLRELREDSDGAIGVVGSIRLVRSLIDAGLLDDLQLLIHPLVVGVGEHLFDDAAELELVSSRALATGVLDVHYRVITPH